jgi:hypothetical protein
LYQENNFLGYCLALAAVPVKTADQQFVVSGFDFNTAVCRRAIRRRVVIPAASMR